MQSFKATLYEGFAAALGCYHMNSCHEEKSRKEATRRCTSYELTGVELSKCIDE
jgi:hypothetical protein